MAGRRTSRRITGIKVQRMLYFSGCIYFIFFPTYFYFLKSWISFSKFPSPSLFSALHILPNSLNIIGKMISLLLSLFSTLYFPLPKFPVSSLQLHILPQQTWLTPLPQDGNTKLYTPLFFLRSGSFSIFHFSNTITQLVKYLKVPFILVRSDCFSLIHFLNAFFISYNHYYGSGFGENGCKVKG